MLYIISNTQELDPLFFVKAESLDEAHRMVGAENDNLHHRLLTDNDVSVLESTTVALIRA